jgi:hypothetical protein
MNLTSSKKCSYIIIFSLILWEEEASKGDDWIKGGRDKDRETGGSVCGHDQVMTYKRTRANVGFF